MLDSNLIWSPIDTWILVTASLAAASCAIPGCYLYLRKSSMMADALTHSALPGVVGAFVVSGWLHASGWVNDESLDSFRHVMLMVGAIIAGLLTAILTEWVSHGGWVRHDAALGAVFTTLFAVGLIMLRQFADHTDIDLDCVLYGQLETVGLSHPDVPSEAWACAVILAVNVLVITILYKEWMLTTFDPILARALGFKPKLMQYALVVLTTTTLVTAFEVVGSILVIGMLVIPPATASLITHRLRSMLVIAVLLGVASAILGHLLAITLPQPLTRLLSLPEVESVRTSGAIVVTAGVLLCLAIGYDQWCRRRKSEPNVSIAGVPSVEPTHP